MGRMRGVCLKLGLLLLSALAPLAGAKEALLIGAIKELAQKAGYAVAVEAPPLMLIKPVSYSEEGEPLEVLAQLVRENLGPEYRFLVEEKTIKVFPGSRGAAEEKEGKEGGILLTLILPDGTNSSAVKSLQVSALVQEVAKPRGVLEVVLSPDEVTCFAAQGEAACLRPTVFSGEGEVPVVLGGNRYTVRYRVVPTPPRARLISLDGTFPTGGFVLKETPVPPLTEGSLLLPPPPTGLWLPVAGGTSWGGFHLAPASSLPGQNWYVLAKYCDLRRLKGVLEEASARGVRWALEGKGDCAVVLLEGEKGKAFAREKGIYPTLRK